MGNKTSVLSDCASRCPDESHTLPHLQLATRHRGPWLDSAAEGPTALVATPSLCPRKTHRGLRNVSVGISNEARSLAWNSRRRSAALVAQGASILACRR